MDIFVFILLTLFLLLIFGMIISAIAESFNGESEAPMIGFTIILIILISTSAYLNYTYQKSLNERLNSIIEKWESSNDLIMHLDMDKQSLEICNGLLRRDIERLSHGKERK